MIEYWMHPDMDNLIYTSTKRFKVAKGGRGSSKSLSFGGGAILYALDNPGSRILCVRGTQNKISESSLQILKDAIYMMKIEHKFLITENTLRTINGSEFIFYGAKNPHTFKSLQRINLCWIDEANELSEAAWDYLIPTIRVDKDDVNYFGNKDSEIWISFNPEYESDPVWKKFIVNVRDDVDIVTLNWRDNPYFPKVLMSELEYDKRTNKERYEHIWEGKLRSDIEGALWNRDMIKHDPIPEEQEYEKIIISIDPSVTAKTTSDACGLIALGRIDATHYNVLEDRTAIMSPKEWAGKAVDMYERWEANSILYESNQGGDLVRTVIKNVNPNILVTSIHAHKGKRIRAEEILYLYEEGWVNHAKHFTILEDEMVTFTGEKKDKSPNALDALVHGLKHLRPRVNKPSGLVLADMSTISNKGTIRPKYNRF